MVFSGDANSGGEDAMYGAEIFREEYSVGWSSGTGSIFRDLETERNLAEGSATSESTGETGSSSVEDAESEGGRDAGDSGG